MRETLLSQYLTLSSNLVNVGVAKNYNKFTLLRSRDVHRSDTKSYRKTLVAERGKQAGPTVGARARSRTSRAEAATTIQVRRGREVASEAQPEA
ncbi:hypothetical protein L596_025188 [Steinernema carpocapsae]|uniref:Uncharacterized protein n=1 Tax=Steinernema carpocapsae TaxID=34508 RepID=A0A4U5M729_STECR|nr:hypothetical protein L596_025188 [Steinernema carpocapsae]